MNLNVRSTAALVLAPADNLKGGAAAQLTALHQLAQYSMCKRHGPGY
jgi:hypothetical protein